MTQALIETHCHLDYLKDRPLEETLLLAKESGVEKIISISVNPENWNRVIEIAHAHPEVYCTIGVHPHQAKEMHAQHWPILESLLKEKKVVAMGEMGLDYHYMKSPKETQMEVFVAQLEVAIAHDLPVVIHSRDADKDMIEVLQKYGPRLKRKGVIHSFTSTQELADIGLAQGFCLGFNGIITFKNATEVQAIAAKVPLHSLLIETDSPFLAPVPCRGRENHPALISHVAHRLSEIRNENYATMTSAIYQNSMRIFWPTVID